MSAINSTTSAFGDPPDLKSCFLIVFVFSTATRWNREINVKKVAVAFAGLIIWVTLKFWRKSKTWWVDLDSKPAAFLGVIGNLERLTYLRDEDEDDNELVQVSNRSDDETGPQREELHQFELLGRWSIVAQHGVGLNPLPVIEISQPSKWHDIGSRGIRRRNTDESDDVDRDLRRGGT